VDVGTHLELAFLWIQNAPHFPGGLLRLRGDVAMKKNPRRHHEWPATDSFTPTDFVFRQRIATVDVGPHLKVDFSWNLKHTLLWGDDDSCFRGNGAMMKHDA